MSFIVKIARNLIQRVAEDGGVHPLTEIMFIAQDVEYVTGPDGLPVRTEVTSTHRFECSAKQLRTVIDVLQDYEQELTELEDAAEGSGEG